MSVATGPVTLVETGPEHADGWARVRRAVVPWLVVSADLVRHDLATDRRTVHQRVAVDPTGDVVGLSRVRDGGGAAQVVVAVHPDHRRRGTGRLLLDAVVAAVGPVPLSGIVDGDPGPLAAARAWGVRLVRAHRVSAVDPGTVPAPSAATTALERLEPAAVWACVAAGAADDPSGLSAAGALPDWIAHTWLDPTHRPDLGRAVVDDDGRVLSVALLRADGDRAWHSFTGTLPEARGAGLARRAKAAALVAAAGAGVTRCSTGNDAANAAMLAVNDALGFRTVATTYEGRRP